MELNKLHSVINCQVDIVGMNRPGVYFLFDDTKKLIYIGQSKFPLLRILDHGETSIRLKSFEILEALTSYFVQYCPSKTVY